MRELTFSAPSTWRTTHPGAFVGILVLKDVGNPSSNAALAERKIELREIVSGG